MIKMSDMAHFDTLLRFYELDDMTTICIIIEYDSD